MQATTTMRAAVLCGAVLLAGAPAAGAGEAENLLTNAGVEDASPDQADVPAGTVAYWPPGKALCLFFGQRPYSPVNIVGQIEGDPHVLAKVRDQESARVEVHPDK